MPLSAWKNGKTFTVNGHDLLLPFDELQAQYQMRHYFFLAIAIYAGGISSKDVVRSFKYQLWDGDTLSFEQEYEMKIKVVWYADVLFGAPAISFVTYIISREKIRTTVINGQPTAEIDVVNTATSSGQVYDFSGRRLDEDEVPALVNPSWEHTLAGTRTGEFGTVILDTDASVGQSTAYLEGRVEMPVYRQTVRPTTEVDIVTDAFGGTGRTDRYQFRGKEGSETQEISGTVDIHGGSMVTGLLRGTEGVRTLYNRGREAYENRGFLDEGQSPSIMATNRALFKIVAIQKELVSEPGVTPERYQTNLNEYTSKNGGWTFPKSRTISKEGVRMPQAVIIDEATEEVGLVLFEGTELVFRRSGDGYASKNVIFDFKTPEPMALVRLKSGTLQATNGKGRKFENRMKGVGPWRDLSNYSVITTQ